MFKHSSLTLSRIIFYKIKWTVCCEVNSGNMLWDSTAKQLNYFYQLNWNQSDTLNIFCLSCMKLKIGLGITFLLLHLMHKRYSFTLPQWKSSCHRWSHGQPQPVSLSRWERNAEEKDPGKEVACSPACLCFIIYSSFAWSLNNLFITTLYEHKTCIKIWLNNSTFWNDGSFGSIISNLLPSISFIFSYSSGKVLYGSLA